MALSIVIETGERRTFASALDWPGWSRSGRGADDAIEALLAYGPRYAEVLRAGGVPGFRSPRDVEIIERLPGDATTDFGAPGTAPAADDRTMTKADLRRWSAIHVACWRAFDAAAQAAEGVALSTGPRGGGRQVEAIVTHVMDADDAYLRKLGGTAKDIEAADDLRVAFTDALARRVAGEIADTGPRGGRRWSARYAIRRSAWHALDHTWEIEDRSEG